jgi:uncharacterized protein
MGMLFFSLFIEAQNIGNFNSVEPGPQISDFIFPATSHRFQKIIEHNDVISNGLMMDNFDFTGFVPIANSSVNGNLSVNHELTVGGVTAMDIQYNPITKLWSKANPTALNFTSLGGISRPCSGGITPYKNVVVGEEALTVSNDISTVYNPFGWLVETNPNTKVAVQKLWAMGSGQKENVCFSPNGRTAYFGNDAPIGYLYKFVANQVNDYSSGTLYAYKGSKSGSGNWVMIPNTTILERNTTLTMCGDSMATVFNGVEDVEIGPDGKIYLAVKNENSVFRFSDSDPITGTTVTNFETFVGNTSYNITHANGTTLTAWGTGNDNLAFDGQGNLWVLQDGGLNYIWVVGANHTQAVPNVKLFGIAPSGSEPTGITFTPDYKFLFLSFQHPSSTNNTTLQTDAAGQSIGFDKDIAIVIALSQNLGCSNFGQACDDGNPETFNDSLDASCVCVGLALQDTLTLAVQSSNDDAEQNLTTSNVNLNSSDLELITDGANQTVGIRFANAGIPYGSQILSAHIQFTTKENTHTQTTNLALFGEKTTNSQSFLNQASNISNRVKTQDSISWGSIPLWTIVDESGPNQKTPDLKNIIQELIGQPNWSATSPVTFIIKGSGKRVAYSFDGNASLGPKLIVSYRVSNENNVGIGNNNPATKLHVKDGDVYLESVGSGVIIKSDNGNCWKLKVQNNGTITSVAIPCPQ